MRTDMHAMHQISCREMRNQKSSQTQNKKGRNQQEGKNADLDDAAFPTHRLYLELQTPLAAQPMPNRIQPFLVLNLVRKPNSPTLIAMPCHTPWTPFAM